MSLCFLLSIVLLAVDFVWPSVHSRDFWTSRLLPIRNPINWQGVHVGKGIERKGFELVRADATPKPRTGLNLGTKGIQDNTGS